MKALYLAIRLALTGFDPAKAGFDPAKAVFNQTPPHIASAK